MKEMFASNSGLFVIFLLHNFYLQTVQEAKNLLGPDELKNLLHLSVIHWDLIIA